MFRMPRGAPLDRPPSHTVLYRGVEPVLDFSVGNGRSGRFGEPFAYDLYMTFRNLYMNFGKFIYKKLPGAFEALRKESLGF